MNVNRQPCAWCGGEADPATTCPRSIDCPRCKGRAGGPCYSPSGHRRDELHAARVQLAEATPPRGSEDPPMYPQTTIDGRETPPQAPPASESHEQPHLFAFAPGIRGQLALDTDPPMREPMRPAGVRHRGEWS